MRRLCRYGAALGSSERALECGAQRAQMHSSRGAVLAAMGAGSAMRGVSRLGEVTSAASREGRSYSATSGLFLRPLL